MKKVGSRTWPVCLLMCAISVGITAAAEPEAQGPWLGVRLGGPNPSAEGVTISGVFEGSPADRAGLRANDVILSFDGEPVTGLRDLVNSIRSHESGAWMPLRVVRQDDEIDVDVRLGDRPGSVNVGGLRRGWVGVQAIDLPETLREHFGAPPEAGVMISEVAEGSPAEAAGLRLGDVVYQVGDKPVPSARALRGLVQTGGVGNDYDLLVARDGALLELETRIERQPRDGE